MADDAVNIDRRRLNRDIPWQHHGDGVYKTADGMNAVRRVKPHQWQRGVRQPYHGEGEWDFTQGQYTSRLRDAQAGTEGDEKVRPRAQAMRTQYHDRRGL